MSAWAGRSVGKVSLYLSSDQTEQLYGIKTDGLYYVRDGMVNQYAMTFQHQVQYLYISSSFVDCRGYLGNQRIN
jgi:hypothetical protein